MDDDFDTVGALAGIFDFVREVNKKGGSKKSYELMKEFNNIFNVLTLDEIKIPQEIKKLVESNKNVSPNGLMGLIMKNYRGKVDGKQAMELIKKYHK